MEWIKKILIIFIICGALHWLVIGKKPFVQQQVDIEQYDGMENYEEPEAKLFSDPKEIPHDLLKMLL